MSLIEKTEFPFFDFPIFRLSQDDNPPPIMMTVITHEKTDSQITHTLTFQQKNLVVFPKTKQHPQTTRILFLGPARSWDGLMESCTCRRGWRVGPHPWAGAPPPGQTPHLT